MGDLFTSLKRRFATDLYHFGMFKDKTKSPEGKGFKLKLHQLNPTAPLSPYYLDLRMLRSYPETAKKLAVDLFDEMIQKRPDVLADIPTAITPIVSTLSDRRFIPMITPRPSKGYGSGASIDGVWSAGDTALLFDDLITEADSKLEAAATLRAAGIIVQHVLVLVDREQGGKAKLEKEGLQLHTAFTISELLDLYHDMGMIDSDLYGEIQAYRTQAV